MTPGTRAIFTLSARNDRDQWREQECAALVIGRPRENYAEVHRAGYSKVMWETVNVLVDGEEKPRPVNVARFVGML